MSDPRINDRIRVPEVRLVGPGGEQVGIVRVEDAMRLARESDLDLVEVAPNAKPPVAKLMDFGKYKYEAAVKARESRKNQTNTNLKEVRFRLKIDDHDYDTKVGHARRFLSDGDKVKAMIQFRGREQSRPEMGVRLLQKLAEDLGEFGQVESSPRQDGRNMVMVLGPLKNKSEARAAARRAKENDVTEDRLPQKTKSSRRDREREARAAGMIDTESALPVGGNSIGEAIPEELRKMAEQKFEVPEGAPPLKVSEDQPPVMAPKEERRERAGGGRGRPAERGGSRGADRGERPERGDRPERGASDRGGRPAGRPAGAGRPEGGRPASSGPRTGAPARSGGPRPASSSAPRTAAPRPAGAAGPRPAARPAAPAAAPKPGTAPKPGAAAKPAPKPGATPKPAPKPGPSQG
ncbi:translation initiation factor IF-3 [Kocuria sp.]|uniref:translation initiation factor IF-3 n=1 Tax=Kocuria sp. TaxID=1871328 RepID=UPI0026E0CD82|nr:translation initiation factor IF-3 [Kocuria sp.]MDO5618717.1 translation initiation factor IF-3 [Kocuria sp.]